MRRDRTIYWRKLRSVGVWGLAVPAALTVDILVTAFTVPLVGAIAFFVALVVFVAIDLRVPPERF